MKFYRQTSKETLSHEIETDIEYFAVETAFVVVVPNLPANCRIEPNMKFHSHHKSAFCLSYVCLKLSYENNEF